VSYFVILCFRGQIFDQNARSALGCAIWIASNHTESDVAEIRIAVTLDSLSALRLFLSHLTCSPRDASFHEMKKSLSLPLSSVGYLVDDEFRFPFGLLAFAHAVRRNT